MKIQEFVSIAPFLNGAKHFAVAGHVHPDGDCAGSCAALYLYIKKNCPDASVTLYLEPLKDALKSIPGTEEASGILAEMEAPEVLFLCDVSSAERIGVAADLLKTAGKVIVIDHHISNPGFGDQNVILPDASSACEVLYPLLEKEKMDVRIASALYTGMVHDSGVFQYDCTGPETLRIAADLIAMGVDFKTIIEETFYARTFKENRILGHVLDHAELFAGGQIIFGYVDPELMEKYGVTAKELDVIVSQLRLTKGTEAAVFLYPAAEGGYKASLRSNKYLDVSKAAQSFGGGGHVRAAGCTLQMPLSEAKQRMIGRLSEMLRPVPAQ